MVQIIYSEKKYVCGNDGNWTKSIMYKSPQGSTIISIQYNEVHDGLLLLYAIDDSVRNTQRFEVVRLQLFTSE